MSNNNYHKQVALRCFPFFRQENKSEEVHQQICKNKF
jgi:hypothetical protein